MRLLLKIAGVLVLLLVACFLIVYILGSRQPHEHTATASVIVDAPQQHVWELITDTKAQPSWRTGLKSVEPLPSQNGQTCWLEVSNMGRMPLCEAMATPPAMRMVRIADPTLPYGGVWNYQLEPLGTQQTRVTITENGTTGPAIWRFVGHYVFHEDTQIKMYETALQAVAVKH